MTEKKKSVIERERSVIIMTLFQLGHIVYSFSNYAMTLSNDADLENKFVQGHF